MAEFTLTSGNDTFTGAGSDVDTFVGTAVTGFTTGATGGIDALDGGAGNDHFYFAHNTTWTGTVLGGLDTDTVHLYGQAGDMAAAPPTFSGVEILDIASTDSTIVRLTSTQLNAFQQITGFVRADNRVALELGGTANVDFSTKLLPGDTFGVNVMLFAATGSRTYTGTANGDYFRDANNSGSHIDTFVGGAGNDTFLANNSGALAIFDGGNDNDRFRSRWRQQYRPRGLQGLPDQRRFRHRYDRGDQRRHQRRYHHRLHGTNTTLTLPRLTHSPAL